jgi:hypothetical protein
MGDGKRHEPNIKTYAIGHADKIEIFYVGGSHIVNFDLKQVRENNFIRYYIEGFRHGLYFDTPEIPDAESVTQIWIEDIDRRIMEDIEAVVVPEYIAESFDDVSGYEVRYTPRV